MIRTHNKNMVRTAYIRVQQQNKLPFTVKPIGGESELITWKQEQAKKEDQWMAKKAAHRQSLILGIESGTLAAKYVKPITMVTTPSLWERFTTWCSELFLKLPFNQY